MCSRRGPTTIMYAATMNHSIPDTTDITMGITSSDQGICVEMFG